MKEKDKETKDAGEMFDNHAEEKRYERRAYRNAVLAPVTTFCIGLIFKAFLKSFGLAARSLA